MRIVIYNAHVEDLVGWRASWLINRRHATDKYWYLLDSKLANAFEIVYFVDGTQSSFVTPRLMARMPSLIRWAITGVEVSIWCLLNNVSLRRIRWGAFGSISHKDVAVVFGRKIFQENIAARKRWLSKFGHIFCHLGHCYGNTTEVSKSAKCYEKKLTFVAEARLDKHSSFFQKQFPWYKGKVLVVPFVPQRRFQVTRAFSMRVDQAVSTGTYHIFSIDPEIGWWNDIRDIMGVDSLHPLRRELDSRKQELKGLIEVRNSYFWESLKPATAMGQPNQKRGTVGDRFVKWFQKVFAKHQDKYFKFDIVELYNRYKYSIVVEEIIGQPGIGAMESMACGCVYIGQTLPMYQDIGMVEGVHYMGYDGTFAGLRARVELARMDPERAERISEEGRRFVADRCSPAAALSIYRDCALRMIGAVQSGGNGASEER